MLAAFFATTKSPASVPGDPKYDHVMKRED
jgi:hypothetical protein